MENGGSSRVASWTKRDAPDGSSIEVLAMDFFRADFHGRRATWLRRPPRNAVDAITGGGTRGDGRDGAVWRERASFRRGVDRMAIHEKAARAPEIITRTRILSLTDDHLLLDSLGLFGLFLRLTHDGKVV